MSTDRRLPLVLVALWGIQHKQDPRNPTPTLYRWTFSLPEGPASFRWSGPDVQAGAIDGIVVRAKAKTRVEAQIRYTGRTADLGRPLRVEVAWPRSRDPDESLQLCGVFRLAREEPDVVTWIIEPGDDPEREPRMRAAGRLIGVIGRTWATGPLEIPRGDTLHVRPQRGGLLVITPEVTRPESMGRLVLRRPDGLPIPRPEEGWETRVRAETGSLRLPDVKATVRAGRTAALVIPE